MAPSSNPVARTRRTSAFASVSKSASGSGRTEGTPRCCPGSPVDPDRVLEVGAVDLRGGERRPAGPLPPREATASPWLLPAGSRRGAASLAGPRLGSTTRWACPTARQQMRSSGLRRAVTAAVARRAAGRPPMPRHDRPAPAGAGHDPDPPSNRRRRRLPAQLGACRPLAAPWTAPCRAAPLGVGATISRRSVGWRRTARRPAAADRRVAADRHLAPCQPRARPAIVGTRNPRVLTSAKEARSR